MTDERAGKQATGSCSLLAPFLSQASCISERPSPWHLRSINTNAAVEVYSRFGSIVAVAFDMRFRRSLCYTAGLVGLSQKTHVAAKKQRRNAEVVIQVEPV